MAEYISRETVLKKLQMQLLDLEADQDKGEYSELCENRGARDALDGAIYDIRTIKAADVQPVDRWISVKDKLPEVGKLVIVCGKQGGVGAMELLSNGKWYSNGMAWSAEWIVYWQPLPDPPKDGDTNG